LDSGGGGAEIRTSVCDAFQQSLRCILLWPDEHYLLSPRIDIDEHRRAIDQIALDLIARPGQEGRDSILVGSNFRSAGLAGAPSAP